MTVPSEIIAIFALTVTRDLKRMQSFMNRVVSIMNYFGIWDFCRNTLDFT